MKLIHILVLFLLLAVQTNASDPGTDADDPDTADDDAGEISNNQINPPDIDDVQPISRNERSVFIISYAISLMVRYSTDAF